MERWYRLNSYDARFHPLEDGEFADLNRCDSCKESEGEYFTFPYLSFGDYDNSCSVERSNVRVFCEMHKDTEGILWEHQSGCYGSEWILFRKSALDNEEIRHTLHALEDYPCLDEEDLSSLELDMEGEAWESDVSTEFRRILERTYEEDGTLEEGTIDSISNDDLWDLFLEACEKSNTYWYHENGYAGIDVDRVADAVELEDLESLLEV